jgi:SAGA-associated factor 29
LEFPGNPSKLRSLYKFAANEALKEEKLIREALKKITEIREIRNERRFQAKNAGNKVTLRQGELMKLVHSLAKTLPLFVSQPGEKLPPLCGCIPADSNWTPKTGDLVAAMVKLGTENNYDCV